MNQALSVSSLNNQIKTLLETTFMSAYVEGEVSNLTYHNSGHIYFSLKDASSTISCVLFKGNAKYLKFRLEVGMKITISGSITVYAPRGNYQLLCTRIEPCGQGALALAYEQLKTKLQAQGYFEQSRKKTLPAYPKHITLITSPTGAAIQDMKKVAQNRWPLCKFTLIPTLVQGEGSTSSIVAAIVKADALASDILIVARGGGSIEDLWAFNEEKVADAIYNAKTPVISAIGHEVDFLISDFVSDVRAATPSNAIEIALPDINEHRIYLDSLFNELNSKYKNILYIKNQNLEYIKKLFEQQSFENKFLTFQKEIKYMSNEFNNIMNYKIKEKSNMLESIENLYKLNHPNKRIEEGYAQITKDGKIIKSQNIVKNDVIYLETPENTIKCKVLDNNVNNF